MCYQQQQRERKSVHIQPCRCSRIFPLLTPACSVPKLSPCCPSSREAMNESARGGELCRTSNDACKANASFSVSSRAAYSGGKAFLALPLSRCSISVI